MTVVFTVLIYFISVAKQNGAISGKRLKAIPLYSNASITIKKLLLFTFANPPSLVLLKNTSG